MTDPAKPRRATCAACLRAQSACICAFVRRVDADAALLVLQHPLEVANAKNTGRLLHLCVAGSTLAVGEAFEPAQLDELLREGGREPVLLYPPTPGDAAAGMATPPEPPPGLPAAVGRVRLVVLDATWRKSRKMLYLNPALQRLPRMALSDVPASGYRIRKAHAPHQLSTFEATAYALAQLQGAEELSSRLLEAFNAFVEQQASFARHA
jgi:DTW domain-containing protein YfiP